MNLRFRRDGIAFPSADGTPLPTHAEVAVIGGGMTGVLTALMLRMRGIGAIVFEANAMGEGGTASCLGMVGLGDGIQLGKIEASSGTTAAIEYAHRISAASDAYATLGEKYGLLSKAYRRPAVLYTQRWEGALESEASVARRIGIPVEMKRRSELPFPIRLSLVYPNQGMIDPRLFLFGLARQVPLFAGVRILSSEGNLLLTEEGDEIHADTVVYACRTPSEKMADCHLPSLLFGHARALSIEHASPMRGMYTGYDHDGLRMVYRGGVLYAASSPTVVQRGTALAERLKAYYPSGVLRDIWSPWDTVTEDGLPLIGEISPHKYLAIGYGGRGLAYAMLAAEMLTDEICGDPHPLSAVFNPKRPMSRVAMRETVARYT